MKNHKRLFWVAATGVVLTSLLFGCDREVSHTGSATVNSDGSSKSNEKVVTQAPDGTVTKEESKKTSAPNTP